MRNQVIQVACDRCGRVETFDKDPGERSLNVTFANKEVCRYGDLCNNCYGLVEKALEQIGKPLKKNSPIRKKETAPEASQQVKVSPPKRS